MHLKLPLAVLAALAFSGVTYAATLTEIVARLATQRRQQATPFVAPQPSAIEQPSATMPTSIHSSIAPADLARIPLVLKADRHAIGLLKWTAPLAAPSDPVVGYEAQPVSGNPVQTIYAITAPELPFNVGMIEVVGDQYWRVRTVFRSGRRSEWNISSTFPENVTLNY